MLSLAENLFDLFSDETINWDAASSIGRIAAPTEVLTKTNYAVTKVRAKCPGQRMDTRSSRMVI